MKKPILLPTKEATNIYLETKDKLVYKPDAEIMSFIDGTPANQYLYIVDTEAEIKENNLYILLPEQRIKVAWNKIPKHKDYVKVICSSDKSLGLPLINKEFVKLFVEKQGKIEEVDVEFEGGAMLSVIDYLFYC